MCQGKKLFRFMNVGKFCNVTDKMPAGIERLLRKVSGYHEFLAECIFTKKLLGIEQLFTIVYFPYMDLQT